MHAPLPFQITVCRFGIWRIGCLLLIAIAGSVTALWAWNAIDTHTEWLAGSVLLWVVASAGLLASALGLRPISLRWDGQVWRLGPASTVGREPQAGRLVVSLDLGSWMLLRFVGQGARLGKWLPVQRRGHESHWRALRATVYCARPVFLPTAAPF